MATIGIEIVDAALIAARDGVRVAASPGVALGTAARLRLARRPPRPRA